MNIWIVAGLLLIAFSGWLIGYFHANYNWIRCAEEGEWVRINWPLRLRVFQLKEVFFDEEENTD